MAAACASSAWGCGVQPRAPHAAWLCLGIASVYFRLLAANHATYSFHSPSHPCQAFITMAFLFKWGSETKTSIQLYRLRIYAVIYALNFYPSALLPCIQSISYFHAGWVSPSLCTAVWSSASNTHFQIHPKDASLIKRLSLQTSPGK